MNNASTSKNNYYLVNIKPSLKVIIDVRADISSANFRSILSFCKQWNIKEVILKVYDLKNTKIFDHLYSAIADTFLFAAEEFSFYLQFENMEMSLIYDFWKRNENPEEFLLSFLNHNRNFESQFSAFGTEVVKFFDFEPEIINVKTDNNKINLILDNPKNIFALFISDKQDSIENKFHKIDLQKHFNYKTGQVIISWKTSKEVQVYVIRKFIGFFDESVHQKLNYFSEKVFKSYLQYLGEKLERNLSLFNGWYLNPYQIFRQPKNFLPINSNFVQTFNDKTDQDYSKTAFNFWYKSETDSHHQSTDLFNFSREEIQKVFKKSYNYHLKTNDKKIIFNLNEIGEKIQQCGVPLFLFDFAKEVNDFNISIEENLLVPNGVYAKEKETELRIVSSITHHYNNKIGSVNCGDLLNTDNNFEDKLWNMNWLTSCGINNLSQSINFGPAESKTNLYSNLPTYDPSYIAYKKWFNYINTINHFSSKGTHRCDVLVLYPIQSYFYGNVVKLSSLLPLIANNGIDFDLIDFDGFINTDMCKIIDNKLSINKEKYSILILPGVEIIPIEVLRRIFDFYSAGGTIIAIGNLPTKSTNWDKDNEIESISNEIWFKKSSISSTKFKTNKWGGKGFFQSDINLLPEIIKENRNLINLQIHSDSSEIRSIVRELSTEYYIMLFNMSTINDFQGNVFSKYKGKPYAWNFNKNEALPYHNFKIKDNYLQFPVNIPARQSKLIILKKQSLKALPKILYTNLDSILDINIKKQKINVNALVFDKGKYELEVSLFNVKKKAFKNIKKFLPALTISSKNWNIEFNNKKIIENLGDLSRYDQTYCGTIIYKKIIVISEEYLNGYKVMLDLGKLKDIAEIFVNDKNLGLCIIPPYRLDITESIQSGDNKFEFKIKNNLFNILSSMQTVDRRYNYIKEYGLYGPVKLIPYKEIEINC